MRVIFESEEEANAVINGNIAEDIISRARLYLTAISRIRRLEKRLNTDLNPEPTANMLDKLYDLIDRGF